MDSSSLDSEEEIGWWTTKNLIKNRLIDNSLIHKLKRTGRLQKESKQMNISLHTYVQTKLRERRQSLSITNNHKNTSDTCATDSESSGMDEVFMVNGKPSTSARFRNNRRATSKSSSNKASAKSKIKVRVVPKHIRAYSKKTEKIENHNPNRKANSSKILRSVTQGLQATSLICANQGNMTLSCEVNNLLSDKPTINKLNGVLNENNNVNGLTNSKEEIKHTLISNQSNITSEVIKDSVRRLPKGPATIKKNLFNTVRNSESDVHESQEIIFCDSESFVNQNKDGTNASSSLYEYSSVFNDDAGRSRNETVSSDDIVMWRIDTTCESTNDSRPDSISSNELRAQNDDASSRAQKMIPAIDTSKTEERTKNDSTVLVQPEPENSTLDDNKDLNIKEINILNTSNESEAVSKVTKRLPNNESFDPDSFHRDVNASEKSDVHLKKSNHNSSDVNNSPQKLNSHVKIQEKNDESSKEETLNDVQSSVPVVKNVEENFPQEMRSPTNSLSFSRCGSVSTDDSTRTRFMPKVKSTEILSARYKIVKLHMGSKDTFVRPLMTSSPNAKSLYSKNNTADEASEKTMKNLEDPECTIEAEDNSKVAKELDESEPEERNNSYTAVSINHPKRIHDFYQEHSERSNSEEADSPTMGRTLNCNTSDESQNGSLNGKEQLTYPKTPRSKKMLHEERSPFERKREKIDRRNSSSSNEANEIISNEVTSDQENEDNSSVSPERAINSNKRLSSNIKEIQSLRCVMQTLNNQKERCDEDVMKEYEEQFLKKREQQSSSESTNTIRDRRPVKLQDLIARNNFTEEASVASLTMNDISDDDEIFVFEIPKTVDVEDFRDKKFRFKGDNEILIGEKKFEVYERENQTMSIVLNKGDVMRSYGAVNLKAVRSIYIRPKILKKEIKPWRIEKVEEVPRPTTVPFPKNLRCRHPLLGSNIVAKKMSDSEENEKMAVTSKKILKWLASQDEYDDDQDSVKNEQQTAKQVKRRKQITEKQDENVEMQYNPVEDMEIRRETSVASTPRKKRSIVLSETFHETGTTNDDMLSMDTKLKKKMLKKKNKKRVDERERYNESDSKTLTRKSSISCSEAESDIPKKMLKPPFESSKDIILTYDETTLVKSARKMKVNSEMKIRGKQSESDTGVLEDENNDSLGLEGSNVNGKWRIRKDKRHSKRKRSEDFDVSTEIYEYVSSPESINADVLSSSSRARGEERKRPESSSEGKRNFLQKVKRRIQLGNFALSESNLEKSYVVNSESSRDKDQSCGNKGSKNAKKKHMNLKDLLKRSYPPKVMPTLSPKKRCRSLNNFARNIESNSGIGRPKKLKLNFTHADVAEDEDKSMNSKKSIVSNGTPILKKHKGQSR